MTSSSAAHESASRQETADRPAVYFGPPQPNAWGPDGAREWRCRQCRRLVDDHHLGGYGCAPREDLLDLLYDLEEAIRQDDPEDPAQPQAVRQALAVLQEHGWQLQQERRHPDLDHPHRQTRLVARQRWQDRPLHEHRG